ncbi:biotin-dependent carboxyltransferase family protein [Actinoplanes sp. NPDC051470]|uniref:5-oxoprolinase subunit C family protein n=1 Tax=unclassified Actinoplanes TaxID=2626549 RepID=UPI003433A290
MRMTVVRTGPRVVVKDLGRPGHGALGVAPSGAADRGALTRANALVGNPGWSAGLECTLGGLRVVFDFDAVVALTGSDASLLVDGAAHASERVVEVAAGSVVQVGMPRRGVRSYLAVRGGIDVAPVLGSRSTDASGLGPARPAAGDELPIGAPPRRGVGSADRRPAASPTPALGGSESSPPEPLSGRSSTGDDHLILEVDLGPRDDWFTDDAVATFLGETYTVTPASDTVGLRLDGPALTRSRTEELPSEGVVRGSVQVPPNGLPIIFQADHPVTGGYPVIAVLTPAAADRAAQLRPGQSVRFTEAPA